MDKDFIKKIEKKLIAERDRLAKELDKIAEKKDKGNYEARFPDYGRKEEENAAEVTTYEEYLNLERNLEGLLKATNSALDEIKNGTYGRCEKCHQEIDKARLEANPQANLCLSCQESEEKSRWARIKRIFRR